GKFRVGTLSLSGSTARGGYGIKSPFHNGALSRRAALDGPWRRPQSRPYLLIRALPASLPGTDHRTPTTRPHYERGSRFRHAGRSLGRGMTRFRYTLLPFAVAVALVAASRAPAA